MCICRMLDTVEAKERHQVMDGNWNFPEVVSSHMDGGKCPCVLCKSSNLSQICAFSPATLQHSCTVESVLIGYKLLAVSYGYQPIAQQRIYGIIRHNLAKGTDAFRTWKAECSHHQIRLTGRNCPHLRTWLPLICPSSQSCGSGGDAEV